MNLWKRLLYGRIVGVEVGSKPRAIRFGVVKPAIECIIAGFL